MEIGLIIFQIFIQRILSHLPPFRDVTLSLFENAEAPGPFVVRDSLVVVVVAKFDEIPTAFPDRFPFLQFFAETSPLFPVQYPVVVGVQDVEFPPCDGFQRRLLLTGIGRRGRT